jgi:hypothetical protein
VEVVEDDGDTDDEVTGKFGLFVEDDLVLLLVVLLVEGDDS